MLDAFWSCVSWLVAGSVDVDVHVCDYRRSTAHSVRGLQFEIGWLACMDLITRP